MPRFFKKNGPAALKRRGPIVVSHPAITFEGEFSMISKILEIILIAAWLLLLGSAILADLREVS